VVAGRGHGGVSYGLWPCNRLEIHISAKRHAPPLETQQNLQPTGVVWRWDENHMLKPPIHCLEKREDSRGRGGGLPGRSNEVSTLVSKLVAAMSVTPPAPPPAVSCSRESIS
jgi:hypothetical protein